ncbi:MAG: hypothetical protein AAGF24_11475 [Cyanobacteria bacterium P01_H01_bin.121]
MTVIQKPMPVDLWQAIKARINRGDRAFSTLEYARQHKGTEISMTVEQFLSCLGYKASAHSVRYWVSKYQAALCSLVGCQRVEYEKGYYFASGAGAFGRQGGPHRGQSRRHGPSIKFFF